MDFERFERLAWDDTMPTTKIDPSELSDEELELQLELLRRRRERAKGVPIEPVRVSAVADGPPAVRVKRKNKEVDPKWETVTKVCPHCEKKKNVAKDFGVIVNKATGVEYANSWCRQCRSQSSAEYKASKRK